MSATSIRSLLNQLTGHEVRVFIQDGRVTGTVAAVTEELLVLASNDDVIWIDIEEIEAVRVLDGNNGDDDDDE